MEKLGRYEIVGELGRGGCGVVYRAVDPSIGRHVAIKTILTRSAEDTTESTDLSIRLRREAQSAGVLSHPNIVTVHEFAEKDDLAYIVMEYVTGETLKSVMARGQQSDEQIVSLLRQAADALDYAHSRGVVHRDVKPANFILSDRGALKIADFGIAKLVTGESTGITQTGAMIGTIHYMAPEQISMQPISGQTDQFALAVIAYEMLTGQKPFQGDSAASILMQVMTAEPPPVEKYRATLGPPATTVLRRALAKDPKDRYPTCGDFVKDLDAALGNEQRIAATATMPSSVIVKAPPKSRAPLVWLLAALAVAAVAMQSYRMFGPGTPDHAAKEVVGSTEPPVPIPEPISVPPSAVAEPASATPPRAAAQTPPPKPPDARITPAAKPAPPPAPPSEPASAAASVVPTVADPELPPGGKYRGPSDGSFGWTGTLARDSMLVLAGNRASSGAISGRGLPVGVPVVVQVDQREVRVVEQPSPANRYRLVLAATADVSALNFRWKENRE
jgi:serine/threonine protein kinase